MGKRISSFFICCFKTDVGIIWDIVISAMKPIVESWLKVLHTSEEVAMNGKNITLSGNGDRN